MKFLFDLFALLTLRIYFFVLKVLPESLKLPYALLLIKLILFFMPRSKGVTFRNLSLCFPNISEIEKDKVWKGMQVSLANNLIGFSKGPSLTKEEVLKKLDLSLCNDIINELQAHKGTGVLLLVPHFGSFELLAQYWCLYDKPYAILARGFGLPMTDDWWNKQRQSHGNTIFSRKGGFKDIIKHLESGKNVAILFDQNVKKSHSIFVDFFGIPASTTKTIGLASQKTNCKILFTTLLPEENGKQKLVAHWITPPSQRNTGDKEKDIHDTILDTHKYLEKYINQYPDQWFWLHRRFKTRPEGEPENLY